MKVGFDSNSRHRLIVLNREQRRNEEGRKKRRKWRVNKEKEREGRKKRKWSFTVPLNNPNRMKLS